MFKLAPLFGDRAVLPRDKELRIFGSAEEGIRLTARLMDAAGRLLGEGVCTAREGAFLLRLPPQMAQSGCTLTITDGKTEVISREVAIGDSGIF